MMIASTDLRNGVTFLRNGEPCVVLKYSLIKMGRGGATVKVNVRNLITGAVVEDSFSSNIKVEGVDTIKRRLTYLYKDSEQACFMNPNTYEQVEIPVKLAENELLFVKEGQSVDVLFWGDRVLSLDIAPKARLKVTDTAPGVKGNSATNLYKSAKLENGMTIRVPLFINNEDEVVVDTRTNEYVERAK